MSPTKEKRPTSSAYQGLDATDYGTSRWMARNQRNTTETALSYLEGDQLGGPLTGDPASFLFLDLGCGTGYSSLTIAEYGFRVIGIELSWDMIHQHPSDFAISLIQADMRQLPLRNRCIDHLVSISAFNFAAEGGTTLDDKRALIRLVIREIIRVLRGGNNLDHTMDRDGEGNQENKSRCVVEFYPTPTEQDLFLSELKNTSFSGGLLIDHPGTKKEKKFLVLSLEK
jgi:SAM-dependent methyltransferase